MKKSKRPIFPSGTTSGTSLTMWSWWMQQERWRNVGFADGGR